MIPFKNAIEPYLSPKYRTVCTQPNPLVDEDNAHLFTATYIKIAQLIGQRDYEMEHTYFNFIENCGQYMDARPGCYRRTPHNYWRIISQDENIGICLFSAIHADLIVDYGESNHWCYDNRVPGLFTLNGYQRRFASAVPYYRARAGYKLGIFDRTLWTIETLKRAYSKKNMASDECMAFLMSFEMEQQGSWMINLAIKKFREQCTKVYGDVSGLYRIYFGENHPLTIYTKGLAFDGTYTPPVAA